MELDLIPLVVAIPLAGAFVIALIGHRLRWLPDAMGFVATGSLALLSLAAVGLSNASGTIAYGVGGWPAPIGIALVLDGLTAFMLVTVNVVSFAIAIYAIAYMETYSSKWKFYSLFLLMLAGMNGVVITGDLFNLYVFLELASVASYALVAFGTERHELEAAFKYAVMSTVGSLFVLLGVVLLYSMTSTLNMADIARVLAGHDSSNLVRLVTVLFIMGFGLKAAVVPFHAWLPDAHPSAPAPISAMLSGVLIKSLGIYALCRLLFNVIGFTAMHSSILLVLGTLSMMVGVLLAIGQWDFKRLLAYHSISQIGYVILGIGLGTPLGIAGGLFHLLNHSVFKALLFLNSGAVEYATGTRELKKMGGLAQKMPVTSGTTLVASMSIAGIPPFNGFWSKLIIILAAIQANRFGYAAWAVLGSVLTLASFMKVMKFAFQGDFPRRLAKIKEVPFAMCLSLVILAVVCIAGGLIWLPCIQEAFLKPAAEALLSGVGYAQMVLGGSS